MHRPVEDLLGLVPIVALSSRYSRTVSFWEAGVNVLERRRRPEAMSPAEFAGQRGERLDDRAQEGRFALPVVADDRRSRPVVDFEVDVLGDDAVGVSDGQIASRGGRSLWGRLRRANDGRCSS